MMTALMKRSVAAKALKVLLAGRASATNLRDTEELIDAPQDFPNVSKLVSWNGKG
jgi:hypothetical protein